MKIAVIACPLAEELPLVVAEGLRFAEKLELAPLLVHVDPNPGVFLEDATFLAPGRFEQMRNDYAAVAEAELRRAAATVAPGTAVEVALRFGKPSHEIVTLAAEVDARLIVVGGGVKARLKHFFYGRTALGIVRVAEAAVLTANVGRVGRPLHHVVFATDLEGGARAAAWAARLAGTFGARLTALHVSQLGSDKLLPYAMTKSEVAEARARLAASLEEVRAELEREAASHPPGPGNVAAQLLFAKDPATEIAHFAADDRADLIVLGTHGRKTLERALLGSVAEGVLHKTKTSLLTVRTHEAS